MRAVAAADVSGGAALSSEAQLRDVLAGIADLAQTLRGVLVAVVDEGDREQVGLLATSAQSLAGTIGYMADTAAESIGGVVAWGGADYWLLSPAASRALQGLQMRTKAQAGGVL